MEPDLILPEVLGVKEVARSRLFRIEEVDLRFSNGFRTRYERIPGGSGAVMVIPFDGKSFLFTRAYCVGTESYELGFVKGKIDPGNPLKRRRSGSFRRKSALALAALFP